MPQESWFINDNESALHGFTLDATNNFLVVQLGIENSLYDKSKRQWMDNKCTFKTDSPLTAKIRSPDFSPAMPAGLSLSTLPINWPRTLSACKSNPYSWPSTDFFRRHSRGWELSGRDSALSIVEGIVERDFEGNFSNCGINES